MTRFRSAGAPVGAGLLLLLGLCAPSTSSAQVATPAAPRTIAEAPDRFFTRGEARLRYRDAGRGEPVVLLHGYTQRIELMQDLADSLSGSFRVIVLDERGFGASSKYSDPARYGRAMIDDVIGLLDHLRIRRAHLVGRSMGALVAARAAVDPPARVASATLLAGPFFPDSVAFTRQTEPFVRELEGGKGLIEFGKWIFPGLPDSLAAVMNGQVMAINVTFLAAGPTRPPWRSAAAGSSAAPPPTSRPASIGYCLLPLVYG